MEENKKELREPELEMVAGGKQDKNDYLYETRVKVETPFIKSISPSVTRYEVWFYPAPGYTRIFVREENVIGYQGKRYVRCIAKVDDIEEGYILQDDVILK